MQDIDKKELRIRRFTLPDLRRLLQIEWRSFGLDAFSKRNFLEWHRKCPDLFMVAEVHSKIVGYIIVCSLRNRGHVVSIAVQPSCRNKGIGSSLASFVFERLRAIGVETVELEVRVTNEEGVEFWQHLGFSQSNVLRSYYDDGEDAFRLRKTL